MKGKPKIRVRVDLDRKLRSRGYSLSDRLTAFEEAKGKRRTIETLVTLANMSEARRSTTKGPTYE